MKLTRVLSYVALLSVLASCQKEEVGKEEIKLTPESNLEFRKIMGTEVPVLKQDDDTYLIGGEGSDMIAFESNFDNPNAEGDPVPKIPGRSALLLGGSGQVRKWPQNTVVYQIGNLTAEMKDSFQQAINEWESKTAVRFVERTNQNNYVTVERTGDNCFCGVASIGQAGSRGILRFGSRAPLSVIIHEIGHTLGYLHEQNRADRDNHVIINFQNIADGRENQFFKSENSVPLTSELDLNSIMMYGSYTFSKNRQPTIVDLNGNVIPRNSGRLSEGDIAGTNQAYPPKDTDTTDTTDGGTNGNEGGEVTNPKPETPASICEGVSEYVRGSSYRVGDKVTYRGFLYQRDFSQWTLLGSCDETQSNTDICSGVNAYVSSNVYQVGDKVTFRGDLYRRVQNGWIKEGQCGR